MTRGEGVMTRPLCSCALLHQLASSRLSTAAAGTSTPRPSAIASATSRSLPSRRRRRRAALLQVQAQALARSEQVPGMLHPSFMSDGRGCPEYAAHCQRRRLKPLKVARLCVYVAWNGC